MLSPRLSRVGLVWRTLLSHYRQHPAQGLFLLIGLSLGVALLLGTLMVSAAAKSAFATAQRSIGGAIVATISPTDGRKTLTQSLYIELRRKGYSQLIPQLEGRLKLDNGRLLAIQGIDAFALIHHNNAQQTAVAQIDHSTLSLLAFSFPPYQGLVSQTLASLLAVNNGDQLTLADQRILPPIKVVSDDFGIGYSLLCDLQCAQDLLKAPQQLTSIALTSLPDNVEVLQALLPAHSALVLANKNVQNQALSEAFFLNITAVSFLAFLVGCFIAFNAVRFSVLQRLNMVQQLRLVGVTFIEISLALLTELLSWALLASVLGCLLGWLIAGALLPSVGLTVVQLFQGQNLLILDQVQDWWLLALLISLTATVMATVQPFWHLAQQQPLQTQTHAQTAKSDHRLGYLGLGLVSLGGLCTFLPPSQTLGFVIAACWFIGGALWVPSILILAYGLLAKNSGLLRFTKLHWAVHDGRFNHARLSVAMMAFTVAIGAGIAVTTMVSSFQSALEGYLDQVLSEQLYVIPNLAQADEIKAFVDQQPSVTMAYRFYHTNTQVSKVDGIKVASGVRGLTDHPLRHQSIGLEQPVDDLWTQFHQRQGILINQTLAFQQQLKAGDLVTLAVDQQTIKVTVLGVYISYGSTAASLTIDQSWLRTLWPAVETAEIGVYLSDPQAVDPLMAALKSRFELQSHQLLKPQQIKTMALKIFQQTFEVTQLLSFFTLLIAAIGIYCACYAGELDRQRQLTLLKVLGVTHRQIVGLSLLQLLFNAIIAALIALPLGIAIAWTSVHIVLHYSFGWHFAVQIQPITLTIIITSAIFIALLAGLIPLYLLGKKTVIDAFREAK